MRINQMRDLAHDNSVRKGFWDESPNFAEKLALVHSEISEALEEHRAGQSPWFTDYGAAGKPEGVPAELADALIRIGDIAGYYDIDLEQAVREKMDYNLSRPHRHGKAY